LDTLAEKIFTILIQPPKKQSQEHSPNRRSMVTYYTEDAH